MGRVFERAREVIRGHARLLFIRNGYEKTTMQQVAVLETAVRHRPADESIATTALLSVLDVWKAQTKQLETDTNVGDPGIADELVRTLSRLEGRLSELLTDRIIAADPTVSPGEAQFTAGVDAHLAVKALRGGP